MQLKLMKYLAGCLAISAGAALAGPAAAQSVTASDPQSIVDALTGAGYPAELSTDVYDDPLIVTNLSDRDVSIVFYGCRPDTHDQCTAIEYCVGFDSDEPVTPERIATFMSDSRFGAVSLDEEGDPWLRWDVVTGTQGIPLSTFLLATRSFTTSVEAMEAFIWPK